MFMKKIGIFVYRSFCVIPLFPREWFRNYNVQEKCCRNELSLTSFNFFLKRYGNSNDRFRKISSPVICNLCSIVFKTAKL